MVIALAAISLACGRSHEGNQRAERALAQLRMVCVSLRLFREDRGRLPSSDAGLRELVEERFLREEFLADPWRRVVRYEIHAPETSVRLSFSGQDAPELSLDCDAARSSRQQS
jgi:hypothetical protein